MGVVLLAATVAGLYDDLVPLHVQVALHSAWKRAWEYLQDCLSSSLRCLCLSSSKECS